MYITINDIMGSKTIDLSYPVKGREALTLAVGPCRAGVTQRSQITVISMFSDNIQYWLKGPMKVMLETGKETTLTKVVYMDKELNAIQGPRLKSQMVSYDDVLRTNKLEKVMQMVISLKELDNSDNLEDGQPSNTFYTYYVTSPEYSMHFEPRTPQYKELKDGMINSLSLKITDQAGNIITDGQGMTVVLHIKYNPL